MDYLILNELSYPFKDKYDAIAGIKIFIKTFAEACSMGLTQLRVRKDIGDSLYHLELAPGYYVYHWLHSHTGEKLGPTEQVDENGSHDDLKDRFRDILTNAPLITDDEPIEKEENERSIFEIIQDGELREAEGLGAAFLLDTIALSFLSIDVWDTFIIERLKHYFTASEFQCLS